MLGKALYNSFPSSSVWNSWAEAAGFKVWSFSVYVNAAAIQKEEFSNALSLHLLSVWRLPFRLCSDLLTGFPAGGAILQLTKPAISEKKVTWYFLFDKYCVRLEGFRPASDRTAIMWRHRNDIHLSSCLCADLVWMGTEPEDPYHDIRSRRTGVRGGGGGS